MKIRLITMVLLLAPTSVLAQVGQMSQTPPSDDYSVRPGDTMSVDPMTTGAVTPSGPLPRSAYLDDYSAEQDLGNRSPQAVRRPRF